MNSEELDSLITGIIRAEDRIRELSQPTPDAAGISDEIAAARQALDGLLDRLCRQLTDYRLLTDVMTDVWEQVKRERRMMRQRIQELETDLERAKRDKEVMREKLDKWCRALNREEEMAARQQ
jgi:chromosome segregation ATPase